MKNFNYIFILTLLTLSLRLAALFDQEHNFYTVNSANQIKPITQTLFDQAKQIFGHLNDSAFFCRENLKNPAFIQQELSKMGAEHINWATQDGYLISLTYLNRNKDTLIVAAPGFGDKKEILAFLVDMFPECDLLLVGYYGTEEQKLHDPSRVSYSSWIEHTFRNRMQREHLDIEAALHFVYIEHPKSYSQVIGWANCYSTLRLCQAQAKAEQSGTKAFDKIILDSCWYSLYTVTEKMLNDPYICYNQSYGGAPTWLRAITRSHPIASSFISFQQWILDVNLHDYSVAESIKAIKKCPILFIQATHDTGISTEEFSKIWDNTHANILDHQLETDSTHTQETWRYIGPLKYALMTPHEHTRSHLKAKELYAYTATAFIENNQDILAELF